MGCMPKAKPTTTAPARHYRHSAVATSSHRGMARGFLPRALSNTCPQTRGMRTTVALHGQVSNKPKQIPPIGAARSSRSAWRGSGTGRARQGPTSRRGVSRLAVTRASGAALAPAHQCLGSRPQLDNEPARVAVDARAWPPRHSDCTEARAQWEVGRDGNPRSWHPNSTR
jgi:hypothetical protein